MTRPYRRDQPSPGHQPPATGGAGLPPHLPAPWTDPADADRSFERDLTHFPQPVTTLDFAFLKHTVEHGLATTVPRFAAPFRVELRRFWTRVYNHEVLYCEPQDVPGLWSTVTREAFAPMLADLERQWRDAWLPELRSAQAFWAAFDLAAAADADLAAHLDASLARVRRVWEIHFEVVYAVAHAWSMFWETYSEVFEGAAQLDAAALVSGFDNLTAEAGLAVWRLRDVASSLPGVADVVAASEPAEALARLRATPGAEPLLAALDAYLARYGRRATRLSLGAKALLEDPTPVLAQLRDAVAQPESDPRRHRERLAADREAAVLRARERVARYPRPLRAEFEHRMRQAQVAVRLKEDHNFIIDHETTAAVRAVVVELAGRLARAGALHGPEDVAHLDLRELRAAAEALAAGRKDDEALDLRDRVAARAAEMERYADVAVPTTLGPPRPVPPQAARGAAPSAGTLEGVGMSAGVARGRVRVARTFDEARALRPGEVLVATSTSQPWTPLFATAAALVTEVGGVLSHMGVIAREYRLPAVAGVTGATELLEDGALVEVDGLAGVVRVLAEG